MAERRGSEALALMLALALAGCGSDAGDPGPDPGRGEVPVFDGIGESEVVTALGTEPFWSARIEGGRLTYSTPDDPHGTRVAVTRFAGNGGLGISGTFGAEPLQLAISPGVCSDAMSERTYPFAATLRIGDALMHGCAYSDHRPFTGEENP